jgi:hypothetical protein
VNISKDFTDLTLGYQTSGIPAVLLPGFQKGQGYQVFLRKRAGAVLAKKGQFASYKEKLEKRTETEFHSF